MPASGKIETGGLMVHIQALRKITLVALYSLTFVFLAFRLQAQVAH